MKRPRASSSVDELEQDVDEELEMPEVEGRVALHSNGRSSTLLPQAPGEDTVDLLLRGPMAAELLFLQATDIVALGACAARACIRRVSSYKPTNTHAHAHAFRQRNSGS